MNFEALFHRFTEIKVAVIGDIMLDSYWWGHVDRISPEAPVPVVALDKRELRIGGAGNVALNTISLGAPTTILSVIGNDDDGKLLTGLLSQNGIDTGFIITAPNRVTTNKTRIMSRNQQMLRLDCEVATDIDETTENALLHNVEQYFMQHQPNVLIFEDYNKGVLTPKIIQKTIALCKQYNVLTAVDPKKKNFLSFKGVDIFKPNLKEVKEGLNLLLEEVNQSVLEKIHAELANILAHKISLVTLSEKGVFYQYGNESKIIPTHVRNIADVSGAGDTVIAVASLVYAATRQIALAADMANIAGGLVCEEVGTAAIQKEKLLKECNILLS
ncbi:MAG: carbohydrate kinase [Hydrotalea flava]|uniref:bifunctional heptose 7-phosphate kinase/heptose 1-phosphate adenyltransferase n=1 Tax=Hydrotalea TaxID=1004300 RepID=UPI000944A9A7|nr:MULTISPECIES: PfkB family carbohydrate kinase [Hydrotalea]NIM36144.1 carbohydrate kinase [Hydrotalea flava]NIM38991.1 carbohydrate kinase [Hydrotalea flava]NIN04180.1 carbohydrate kinase [Hydrotalea flava]NIN15853.1 carbohydrate kinase [Hydrotalea flava]NIO94917.1 carbohydrate kinase [Hydrotalea flava]